MMPEAEDDFMDIRKSNRKMIQLYWSVMQVQANLILCTVIPRKKLPITSCPQ